MDQCRTHSWAWRFPFKLVLTQVVLSFPGEFSSELSTLDVILICSRCFLVSTNLPVMVWIYGGAFLWGGSMGANFLNNYLYSGQEIADRGDVIVVTLGYRLGPLGFLSTGDSNLPGEWLLIKGIHTSVWKNVTGLIEYVSCITSKGQKTT